ncbi:NAD-binding protein [Streptosporangium lutulentum]
MSPVFGHGRLRLYLLKLLEESPRHGYEVIRLLQDRFLGVYSPSPGTIYPRLARLEEEGLVTHELVDGKKVFTITDQGRAELNARLDELADLEQEISDSVRDIAREVKEDVRDTVKSLREELTQMARDVRQGAKQDEQHHPHQDQQQTRQNQRESWREQKAEWQRQKTEWQRHKREWQRHTNEWKHDWKRIWADTFTGEGSRDSDARLGQMLADFVEEVRQDAANARVSEETLAAAQDALYDAARRIRDALDNPPVRPAPAPATRFPRSHRAKTPAIMGFPRRGPSLADTRNDPVVVIGLGRFGSSLALELTRRGTEVLAIDSSPSSCRAWRALTHVVAADSTDLEALRQLGVPDFYRAVVAIGTDLEGSILTTSLLVELEIDDIWAKAVNHNHGRILQRVGAHHVILPEHDMGERVAHLLNGRMFDYMEVDENYALVKTRPPREYVGVPLGESNLRRKYGVTVVCVKSADEEFTYAQPARSWPTATSSSSRGRSTRSNGSRNCPDSSPTR